MAILTTAQVIAAMNAYITATRPDVSVQQGTVTEDVVVNAPAQQFGAVYTTLSQTQQLQSLEFAATMTTDQLDALGANYGMARLPGTQATSIITFRIRNYNFSSSTINIPAGSVVSSISTSTVPSVSFTTQSTLVFLPSLAPSYFNPITGFYEQTVSIASLAIGATNNVGAGSITQLITSIPGIDAIINTVAATGGTDTESNTAFAQRIVIKLSGNNVGTPNGIVSLVEATPGVIQAIVVGPNDPVMLRNQFGGSVDVYVRGQDIITAIDNPVYSTSGAQQFILNHQPALSISSIAGIFGALPYTFAPNADYSFVENPNILFAGSTQSESYVNFAVSTAFNIGTVSDTTHLIVSSTAGMQIGSTITQASFSTLVTTITDATHVVVVSTTGFSAGTASFTGLKPDNNTQLTITYTYDSLIESIQSTFNNGSNYIVASDILIKEAIEAFVNVTTGITIVPGYVGASVVTTVQTALTTYINALGLGVSIPLSELVAVIQAVPGVSDVDLSSLTATSTINAVVTTIPPGQVLTIPKNSYSVANTLIITIES